ncbi:Crp/Fnr family transcriptional regulator [Belliella marina]|uniref:Crp/Fnr family transcriptional regulator n=1 Tax=Belliella marina TaxID=1644146 RepID=A0ABW4VFX8_9BACT
MKQVLLDHIARFITIDEQEKGLIDLLFQFKNWSRGEYFLAQGDVCKEIGFLTKGLVVYFIQEDESHAYNFGKESDFVCNYESFLTKTPSSKSIKCIENVEMLCINYDKLQQLYSKIEQGEKMGRLISEQLFLESIANITSFYVDTPEQRYLKFLEHYPDLNQRIPQYLIASYIQVKPQSLSRIRKRMLKK